MIVEGLTGGEIETRAGLVEAIPGRTSSFQTAWIDLSLSSPCAHTLQSARLCLARARRRLVFRCPAANADPR